MVKTLRICTRCHEETSGMSTLLFNINILLKMKLGNYVKQRLSFLQWIGKITKHAFINHSEKRTA